MSFALVCWHFYFSTNGKSNKDGKNQNLMLISCADTSVCQFLVCCMRIRNFQNKRGNFLVNWGSNRKRSSLSWAKTLKIIKGFCLMQALSEFWALWALYDWICKKSVYSPLSISSFSRAKETETQFCLALTPF